LQEMIRGTRQQSNLIASQFETALGLEVFRNDLGNAGYGLPEGFLHIDPTAGTVTSFSTYPLSCYSEPNGHGTNPAAISAFNDCPNPPRAFFHRNDVGSANDYIENSDYLVVRSPAVGTNAACGKWTYITSGATDYVHVWSDPSLDMTNGNRMIVVKARTTTTDVAQLVINNDVSSKFSARYNGSELISGEDAQPGFRPPNPPTGERNIAYGIEDDDDPARPFNRADYYVRRTSWTNAGCAPGTGTLFKAVANQGGDGFTVLPVMDCVANMQVVFRIDTNGDGVPDSTVNDISSLNAMEIKERVEEIQVYILAHEGAMDRTYTRAGTGVILLGPSASLGRNVDVQSLAGANWDHYRWKIYTLFVKPRGMY
ncbi:MAG TPA: hypothetical protein VHO84_08910, partial [Syntrophorhabdaceae bacterium]|nr:hypothetical protein [Syntrophorhabdaceae bacterium]